MREKQFILPPILGLTSLPIVLARPDERHVNRTTFVMEWYDRHRAYNIWLKRRRAFLNYNTFLVLHDIVKFGNGV